MSGLLAERTEPALQDDGWVEYGSDIAPPLPPELKRVLQSRPRGIPYTPPSDRLIEID